MRKIALALVLSLGLSGCAAIQKLEEIAATVAGTTVSPQQLYIAANAFDATKVTATSYFTYCQPFVNRTTHRALASAPTPCSDKNRRGVFKYVRSGTAARDQAETYLATGASAPRAIYETLIAAVNGLKASASAQGAIR